MKRRGERTIVVVVVIAGIAVALIQMASAVLKLFGSSLYGMIYSLFRALRMDLTMMRGSYYIDHLGLQPMPPDHGG